MKTISQILGELAQSKKYNPDLKLSAEILLSHALKKSREWILTHDDFKLNESQLKTFHNLFRKHLGGEPIAYILSYKHFFGLKFKVDSNTLIPRPETELLVEKVLELEKLDSLKNKVFLDLGTGSGAIVISLAKNLSKKKCAFHATDISKNALKIAKENARDFNLENKIEFLNSDLLSNEKIKKLFRENSEIIICANLPYLSKEIYNSCKKNVKDFEPKTALLSGEDGLNHYRRLFSELNNFKQSSPFSATIFCEISPEQKTLITKEIGGHFDNTKFEFFQDLAGKWRLVKIEI